MFSAELLANDDRCHRAGYFSRDWESQRLHQNAILFRSIEEALQCDAEDIGQFAGDSVFTYAADRGIQMEGSGVYAVAQHTAALADLITVLLRGNGPPWARPADTDVKGIPWISSAFVDPNGVRLHRVVLVDRWSRERELAERHHWKTMGECCVYGLPQTLHIALIGQRREGRHHSPWSKGWWHPSFGLRIRKKDGSAPKGFKAIWREEADTITRDRWIEQMREDGVLSDVLFEVNYELPIPEIQFKIRRLAEKKLRQIQNTTETPDPTPSQCWWPTPCQFASECWQFREPSEKNGFLPLGSAKLK